MIVNFVHEFYAKCNRTVVILRVCLFLLSTLQRQSDIEPAHGMVDLNILKIAGAFVAGLPESLESWGRLELKTTSLHGLESGFSEGRF